MPDSKSGVGASLPWVRIPPSPPSRRLLPLAFALSLVSVPPFSLPARGESDPLAAVEAGRARAVAISRQIWDWAELGYLEERSSALLQEELRAAGFRVETGRYPSGCFGWQTCSGGTELLHQKR